MKELDEFIEKSAQTALSESKIENGYSCEKLKKLDKPILARTIEILCNKENIEPESVHIELIEKAIKNSGAVSIKNGIMAISSQGIFRIYHKNSLNDSERKSEIPVFINSSAMICNKNIRTELVNMEEFLARAKFTKIYLPFRLIMLQYPMEQFSEIEKLVTSLYRRAEDSQSHSESLCLR